MGSLASICSEKFSDSSVEARHSRLKEEIANFDPQKVGKYPIPVETLTVTPENAPKGGWEGSVFFGKIGEESIAIKFYKKQGLQIFLGNDLNSTDYENKLRQSHFLLFALNQLGLGPEPKGYLDEHEIKGLAKSLGLNPSDYYGAIAMQRLYPKFIFKDKKRKKIPKSDELMSNISNSLRLLDEFNIEIEDLDFVLEENGDFYFFDLDLWSIRNARGTWSQGRLEHHLHEINNDAHYEQSIFLRAFK